MFRINLIDTKWLRGRAAREQHFYDLLKREEMRDLFDDGFFEGLEKRKEQINKTQVRLGFLELPILLFLVFTIVPTEAKITILGIGNADKFREAFLFLMVTIGFFAVLNNIHVNTIEEMLNGLIRFKSEVHPEVKPYLEARFGTVFFPPIPKLPKDIRASTSFIVMHWLSLAGLVITFLATVAFVIYVQVAVIIDIYQKPSFSITLTHWLVAYAVFVQVTSVLLVWLGQGWLPVKDFGYVMALAELKDKNPAKYEKIIEKIARSGGTARPKLP